MCGAGAALAAMTVRPSRASASSRSQTSQATVGVVHLVQVVDDEQPRALGHREGDAQQEGLDLVEVPDHALCRRDGRSPKTGARTASTTDWSGRRLPPVPRGQPSEPFAHVLRHGHGVVQLVDPGEAGDGRFPLQRRPVAGERVAEHDELRRRVRDHPPGQREQQAGPTRPLRSSQRPRASPRARPGRAARRSVRGRRSARGRAPRRRRWGGGRHDVSLD